MYDCECCGKHEERDPLNIDYNHIFTCEDCDKEVCFDCWNNDVCCPVKPLEELLYV